MTRTLKSLTILGVLGCTPLLFTGCDREIGREKTVDVKDDGTVRTQEKTVTQNADGTTTVHKEQSETKP